MTLVRLPVAGKSGIRDETGLIARAYRVVEEQAGLSSRSSFGSGALIHETLDLIP